MVKVILLGACAASTLTTAALAQPTPRWRTLVAGERVDELPLGAELTQRVLWDAPVQPRATLIMLPGGSGEIGLRRGGELRHDDNFLVRTRADWVRQGYAVLIPDTIDQADLRASAAHPLMERWQTLATYARRQIRAPVFLLGTSQGAIAAVNGAAHARPGLVSGVVLTETVSQPGRFSTETVFDADPQDVRVPTLVVADRDDACDVAPPAMVPRVVASMTRSPDVRALFISGGVQASEKACGSLSPHGYYGIEVEVVAKTTAWLRAHGG